MAISCECFKPIPIRYARNSSAICSLRIPDGANLDRAVAALRADPYVASAQEPIAMELSSVNVVDFGIDDRRDESVTSAQYGRDALDIDAAWAITGGGLRARGRH